MSGLTKTPYEEMKEENERLRTKIIALSFALDAFQISRVPEAELVGYCYPVTISWKKDFCFSYCYKFLDERMTHGVYVVPIARKK